LESAIAGDDGLEDPDIASELAGATAAIEGHASGAGGGAISTGESPSPSALTHGQSKCQALNTASLGSRIVVKWWPNQIST